MNVIRQAANRCARRLVLAATLAACACLPTGRATVDLGVIDTSRPPLASESLGLPDRIELTAAINETVDFAFSIRSGAADLDRPTLHPTTLTSANGTIPADALTLYRMLPVTVGPLPGWHLRTVPPGARIADPLDVLVPLNAPRGGMPTRLPAAQPLRIWCDLSVEKGTPPGRYSGEIELRLAGRPTRSLPIILEVLPVLLPDQGPFPLLAELDHRALVRHHIRVDGLPLALDRDDWHTRAEAQAVDSLLLDTILMLRAHRLDPVLHELAPLVRMAADGSPEADWSTYDRVVAPLLDGSAFPGRVPLPAWPIPIENFVRAGDGNKPDPAEIESATARVARLVCSHFDDRGWLPRAYALAPGPDDAPGATDFEILRRFTRAVRRAHDDARVASRLPPADLAPLGWTEYPWSPIERAADIWLPPAQFYDPAAMQERRSAGQNTWLNVDRPPYSGSVSIHARPADVLVLPWQAMHLRAGAIYLDSINQWPAAGNPDDPTACIRHDDQCLIYPGGTFGLDRPVASVRLKRLRRAMQDAACADVLTRSGLEFVVEPLRRALVSYAGAEAYRTHFADGRPAGWPDDASRFEIARRIMSGTLAEKLAAEDDHRRDEIFSRNAAWRRLMLTSRRLAAAVEGVRVRKDGPRPTDPFRVECSVVLHNNERVPISGTLRFLDLPHTWTAAPREVAPIPPGAARRVVIEATAQSLPTDASGTMLLPVEFVSADGDEQRMDARLAHAIAVRRGQEITIDGDLADWPVGVVNVMADFVLITGPARAGEDPALSRPRRATTAFVLRDERFLYVAVRCAAASAPGRETRRTAVTFQDLVPVGEELVELLIDPSSSGTRSPTDLYHVVIKRSGALLAEQGIEFNPPCGRRLPWAPDIESAVQTSESGWSVELRIPLTAFGERATRTPVWGFNLTRVDADLQEFSTWSGCVGNAYDPLATGNLLLP